MSSPKKRREIDLMKLMMSDIEVEVDEGMDEFHVLLRGPPNSMYHGGVWRLKVVFSADYPYDPPLIVFTNRIYHPNIDEHNGSICLDVIKNSWSSMFDLVNVFEQFLPQLLLYPNPDDPLNTEAAALMIGDPAAYEATVREYCARFAKPEDLGIAAPPENASDDEITEDEHDSSDDGSDAAGPVDPQPEIEDEPSDAAGPVDPQPEIEDEPSDAAGAVDPDPEIEDEPSDAAGPVDPDPEIEDEPSDAAGPVDAPPSVSEDEQEEPNAGPVDPHPLLSLTESLCL